ncbi:hypothetical protein RB620_03230 [Paenibacillus sp. LHD-117]|nr:hypothetical protein [Paenibacillus sp. LHD-117]MDQ6418442.1 hypothetical protein [Paenibacillus sp. LHD-117]
MYDLIMMKIRGMLTATNPEVLSKLALWSTSLPLICRQFSK